MKNNRIKTLRFIAIAILTVMAFGIPAMAAENVTARLASSTFYVDNSKAQIVAYNIKDNNYMRLRDIGKAVGFATDYDNATRSVYIDSSKPYTDEGPDPPQNMPSETTAQLSDMPIYVDGKLTPMTAYAIMGNNFVKLRDVGQALNFAVDWDGTTNSVYIDTSKPYEQELTSIVNGTGGGQFSSTPIQSKVLDGTDRSPMDYSQKANPAIFNDKLTRGAYNAIYDTMLKKDSIIPGNNEKKVNPYYDYAYSISTERQSITDILISVSSYYTYESGAESIVQEIYKYPTYSICKVYFNLKHDENKALTDKTVQEISILSSERDRVQAIVDYMCERLTYNAKARDYGETNVFEATPSSPVEGACGLYSSTFQYLCDRLEIPCLNVVSDTHAWNTVYIDGEWLCIDVSSIDIGWTDAFLVKELARHTDAYPNETIFAKELVVPGSTIK